MDKTYDVFFGTDVFRVNAEETLYEALRRNGVIIQSACGGAGRCGKCKIQVQGNLNEPSEYEKNILGEKDLEGGIRLACCAKAHGSLRITRIEPLDTQIFAIPDPFTSSERLKVGKGATRISTVERSVNWESEACSEWEGMNRDTQPEIFQRHLSPLLAAYLSRKLPRLLHSSRVTELYYDGRIRDLLTEDETVYQRYFLAVDIGTTTLTLYLLDSSGRWKGGFTAKNPQIPFGADVISRITHSLSSEGLAELKERLTTKIDQMIEKTKKMYQIKADQFLCIGLVGNTCMQQLFWGILPYRLGKNPFRAFTTEMLTSSALEAGFRSIEASTPVVFLPSVAGYVGSDALAGALWCNLDRRKTPYLLVDIGTNGEILLNHGKNIYCCSAAAGPALEGMNISFGMQGIEGALSNVYTRKTGEMEYSVIGDTPLKGICGSGLLSLIAWLLRQRILKPNGTFEKKGSLPDPMKEFLVNDQGDTRWYIRDSSRGIFLNQQDVRQFQLAKGAIRCGIDILMELAGIGPKELAGIFISGSFGNALDRNATIETGLLPPVEPEKIVYVGNAACKGLSLWLTQRQSSKRLERLLEKTKNIRLESYPDFSERFCLSMRMGEFIER
jgi:uncharacterized 2Fe-2S/4Fe-4S cluster protein (DUF4445 family)